MNQQIISMCNPIAQPSQMIDNLRISKIDNRMREASESATIIYTAPNAPITDNNAHNVG